MVKKTFVMPLADRLLFHTTKLAMSLPTTSAALSRAAMGPGPGLQPQPQQSQQPPTAGPPQGRMGKPLAGGGAPPAPASAGQRPSPTVTYSQGQQPAPGPASAGQPPAAPPNDYQQAMEAHRARLQAIDARDRGNDPSLPVTPLGRQMRNSPRKPNVDEVEQMMRPSAY